MHLHPANLFRRWLSCSLALALVLGFAGCTTGSSSGESHLHIDTLVLVSAPAAVDVDSTPGPDGIAIRIYATSSSKSKALPINTGQLEILMFDGVISEQTPSSTQPLRVWSRSASELKPFATKNALGISYPLTLLWGDARPQQDNITIIARYLSPDGRPIYSAPSTIPVGDVRR